MLVYTWSKAQKGALGFIQRRKIIKQLAEKGEKGKGGRGRLSGQLIKRDKTHTLTLT